MLKRIVMCLLLCFPLVSCAVGDDAPFEEGKHFKQASFGIVNNDLVQEQIKANPDKVKVIEFFSYACHWCSKLDPLMEKWQKAQPDFIQFERVPVAFQPSWNMLSRAYFTVEALDVVETVHSKLFTMVQSRQITGEDKLQSFFEQEGVEVEKFASIYKSFGVNNKLTWASAMARAYQINAIPMIVVQSASGTFFTSVYLAGNEETLFQIIEFLAEKAHKANA